MFFLMFCGTPFFEGGYPIRVDHPFGGIPIWGSESDVRVSARGGMEAKCHFRGPMGRTTGGGQGHRDLTRLMTPRGRRIPQTVLALGVLTVLLKGP